MKLLAIIFTFICSIVKAQGLYEQTEYEIKFHADTDMPGLHEKIDLSVSNIPLHEFLRGVAATGKLNLFTEPSLNTPISFNFKGISIADMLLFICKKYSLTVEFTGNIMNIIKIDANKAIQDEPLTLEFDSITHTLTADLNNDSISGFSKIYAKKTGYNLVYSPDISKIRLNGYVYRMPLQKALSNIAYQNGLKTDTSEINNIIFYRNSDQFNASASNDEKSAEFQKSQKIPTSKKQHKGANQITEENRSIKDLIAEKAIEKGKNYCLVNEIKGSIILHEEVNDFEMLLEFLSRGTPYSYRKEGSLYIIAERNSDALKKSEILSLKYRTIDKITDLIPADLKKDLELKTFPEQNSLIISGPPTETKRLSEFIREIDKVVPVIAIEVIIADVRNSRSSTFGIEAGTDSRDKNVEGTILPGVQLEGGTAPIQNLLDFILGKSLVNLGKVGTNFYLQLKALETQGVIHIRSTPHLATLNGHEANMTIGQTQYYLETSTNIIGTQNPQNIVTQQYKAVSANLALTVSPILSSDGQITMDITVKQSNFTERIAPSAPPGMVARDFQSQIRVKSDEMIVLGGLEEEGINETGSGIPILSRIPILKWLFGSRTKSKNKGQLNIFIKPTVIN